MAACLDLTLRLAGEGTLDSVLRRLWKLDRPVTEDDIADALAAEAGRPVRPELQAWVHGTGELPLPSLLYEFGVTCRPDAPPLAAALGLRLKEGPVSGITVRHVLRGSVAEQAGVMPGDELLAVDGWRLRRLEDARAWVAPAAGFELLLVRDQRVRTLAVPPVAEPAMPGVALRLDDQAGAAALARRRAWLGS